MTTSQGATAGESGWTSGGVDTAFSFGGQAIAVRSNDRQWLAAVRLRWGAFASPQAPTFWFTHRKCAQTQDPGVPSDAGTAYDVLPGPGGFELAGRALRARVDLGRRAAVLDSGAEPELADVLLREVLPYVLEGGLMIHAAALADGPLGWIASGPSGCGKSTLASLFPERALCDEHVAVCRVRDGFEVRSLPFWRSRPGRAHLSGVLLLRHGLENRRQPVEAAEASRHLARQVVWPIHRQESMRAALAVFAELIASVPVWDLAFAPTRDVWPVLTGVA